MASNAASAKIAAEPNSWARMGPQIRNPLPMIDASAVTVAFQPVALAKGLNDNMAMAIAASATVTMLSMTGCCPIHGIRGQAMRGEAMLAPAIGFQGRTHVLAQGHSTPAKALPIGWRRLLLWRAGQCQRPLVQRKALACCKSRSHNRLNLCKRLPG